MDINGKYKSWDAVKHKYNLTDKKISMAPTSLNNTKLWLKAFNKNLGLSVNLAVYDHNLIKNYPLYALHRFVSKELYNISLSSMYEKPTSQNCFKKLFETTNLN